MRRPDFYHYSTGPNARTSARRRAARMAILRGWEVVDMHGNGWWHATEERAIAAAAELVAKGRCPVILSPVAAPC